MRAACIVASAAAASAATSFHGRLTRLTLKDPSLRVLHGLWKDDADWFWDGQPGLTGCYGSPAALCSASWAFRGRSLRLFGSFDGEQLTLRVDDTVVRSFAAGSGNASGAVRELWAGSWDHLRPRTLTVAVDEPTDSNRPLWQGAVPVQHERLVRLKYAVVTAGGWLPYHALRCGGNDAATDGPVWEVVAGRGDACGAPDVTCEMMGTVQPGAACHLEASGRGFRVWHSVGSRARVLIDGVGVAILDRAAPVTVVEAAAGSHVVSIVAAGPCRVAGVETLPADGDPVVAVNAGAESPATVAGAVYAADDDDSVWSGAIAATGAAGTTPERGHAPLSAASDARGFAAITPPLPPDLTALLTTRRQSAAGESLTLRLPAAPGVYELRLWLATTMAGGYAEYTTSGAPSNSAVPPDEVERRSSHISPKAADLVLAPVCAVPIAARFTQADTPHAGWAPGDAPGASVTADPYSGLYCTSPCGDGSGSRSYDFRAAYFCAPRVAVVVDGYNVMSATGDEGDLVDLGATTGGVLNTPIEIRRMVQVQPSGVLEVVVAPPRGAPYGTAVHAAGLFSLRPVCFD